MSLVLSGPRRIYVLMLFCQPVPDACSACPRLLSRVEALEPTPRPLREPGGQPPCRSVATFRFQRLFGKRVIGMSFFVLAEAA